MSPHVPLCRRTLRQAFGPDLGTDNRRFEIAVADLRETHESNDRLVQSIEALMTTVVTIGRPDGSTQSCENSQTRLNYLKAQATWGISVKLNAENFKF